jgi:hypothetical protein
VGPLSCDSAIPLNNVVRSVCELRIARLARRMQRRRECGRLGSPPPCRPHERHLFGRLGHKTPPRIQRRWPIATIVERRDHRAQRWMNPRLPPCSLSRPRPHRLPDAARYAKSRADTGDFAVSHNARPRTTGRGGLPGQKWVAAAGTPDAGMPFLFRATPQHEHRRADSSLRSQPEGGRALSGPPAGALDATKTPQRRAPDPPSGQYVRAARKVRSMSCIRSVGSWNAEQNRA